MDRGGGSDANLFNKALDTSSNSFNVNDVLFMNSPTFFFTGRTKFFYTFASLDDKSLKTSFAPGIFSGAMFRLSATFKCSSNDFIKTIDDFGKFASSAQLSTSFIAYKVKDITQLCISGSQPGSRLRGASFQSYNFC